MSQPAALALEHTAGVQTKVDPFVKTILQSV